MTNQMMTSDAALLVARAGGILTNGRQVLCGSPEGHAWRLTDDNHWQPIEPLTKADFQHGLWQGFFDTDRVEHFYATFVQVDEDVYLVELDSKEPEEPKPTGRIVKVEQTGPCIGFGNGVYKPADLVNSTGEFNVLKSRPGSIESSPWWAPASAEETAAATNAAREHADAAKFWNGRHPDLFNLTDFGPLKPFCTLFGQEGPCIYLARDNAQTIFLVQKTHENGIAKTVTHLLVKISHETAEKLITATAETVNDEIARAYGPIEHGTKIRQHSFSDTIAPLGVWTCNRAEIARDVYVLPAISGD